MFVVVKAEKVRTNGQRNMLSLQPKYNPYGLLGWAASNQNKNPQSDHSSQQSTKTGTHRVSRGNPIILTDPKLWFFIDFYSLLLAWVMLTWTCLGS